MGITPTYGVANPSRNLAQVHDHAISDAHEISTVVHELGHLFGAPDHYTGAPNGWTLTQLDAYDGDDTQNLFNNACLYGNGAYDNDNDDVINNLSVCTGCTKVIRGEIVLPDKPPTTTS